MNKPGKKVGDLFVETDDKRKARFELRLTVSTGMFHVVHNGQTYSSKSKDELQSKLREVVEIDHRVTWTKYIELRYTSRGIGRSHWGRQSRNLDLNERAPMLVRALDLDWTITEYSSPHIPVGESEEFILERDESGTITSRHRAKSGRGRNVSEFELPTFTIPYTEERIATLQQIRIALTSLDRKLREFLGADSSALQAALDRGFAASGLPALPPPPPVPCADSCASKRERSCDCGMADEDAELDGEPQECDPDCATRNPRRCDCGANDSDDD